MNTKTISPRSMAVIDQYLHFRLGSAECAVPYFNNSVKGTRLGLRATIGKGSPKDIYEEVDTITLKKHIDRNTLTGESLKKVMTDENIGIDCSGLLYYILEVESTARNKGALDRRLIFVNCHGILGKMKCSLRPAENCDVATFADDKNSRVIPVKEIEPGDMITMIGSQRDHILVVHQVDYQNFVPTNIHYTHSISYPTDGVYGTGVRQGEIVVASEQAPITMQSWMEKELLQKLTDYRVEIRRLNSFCVI